MIKTEELLKIYENGIDFNTFARLHICKDGATYLFKNLDFTDIQLLGLVNFELIPTKKGNEIYEKCIDVPIPVFSQIDFAKIKGELEQCLLSNYGKKQKKGFGDVYFIPSEVELQNSLKRFWKHFPKLQEIDKITKILKNHIINCSKKNSFAPAVRYFIIKQQNGSISSPLASAYENWEEETVEKIMNQDDNAINI